MHNEIFIPQADSRHDSLSSRSVRVPARTLSATRGEAISFDSIASFDGIPISVFGGREIQREQKQLSLGQARKTRMKFLKSHPISVSWWVVMLTIGGVLQFTVR